MSENIDINKLLEQIYNLKKENQELKSSKKFGLVWEEKREYLLLPLEDGNFLFNDNIYKYIENINDKVKCKSKKDNTYIINNLEYTLINDELSTYEKDNIEYLVKEGKLLQFIKQSNKNFKPIFKSKNNSNYNFISDINKPMNYLIEGDNYHSLQLLKTTHYGKIDVIYIDPPYNTGEEDFKYNDKFIDKEDGYRHSKWLTFMKKRLEISKELLTDEGFIFLSIDENERHRLRMLLEEIFGVENFLADIIWDKRNPKGNSNHISSLTENIIVFAKNINNQNTKKILKVKKVGIEEILKKSKELFSKLDKLDFPSDFKTSVNKYKLTNKIENINDFKVIYDLDYINKEFKQWMNNQSFKEGLKAYSNIDENGEVFSSVSMESPTKSKNQFDIIHPLTNNPTKKPSNGWRFKFDNLKKYLEENSILFGKNENTTPRRKYFLKEFQYETMTDLISYASSGMKDLENIGMDKYIFNNPKPLFILNFLLQHTKKDSIILDYFSGSGTTGHAVQQLNQEDGGNRQYIMMTNNENNICESITYERMTRINNPEKYKLDIKKVIPLPHNLTYLKTEGVDINNDYIVENIIDMIKLKENVFIPIETNQKTFENKNKRVSIYFCDEDIKQINTNISNNKENIIYLEIDIEDIVKYVNVNKLPYNVKYLPIPEELQKSLKLLRN